MKRFIAAFLATVMIVAMAGCTSQAKSETPSSTAAVSQAATSAEAKTAAENMKIAVLLKPISNEYWKSMKAGIEDWATKNNVKVDVYAAESETNLSGQLDQMQNIITKNYSAICAAPLSAQNLVEGVINASQKGIPVVNIDETIDPAAVKAGGGSMVGEITTQNVTVGQKAGEFITKKIGKGQVAIIEGTSGNLASSDRVKGATEYLNKQDGIKVFASQPGNWDRLISLDVATNIMQTYPDLKAFYCANDTMALGVYEAVVNAKKTDKIIVVGTDAIAGSKQSISEGKMAATVGQDNVGIGVACVKLAIKAVNDGWKPDPSANIPVTYIDSYLVTPENVKNYLSK